MFHDSENEIEISGCNFTLQTRPVFTVRNYFMGYQFIFNKNTKYEFEKLQILLMIDQSKDMYVKFRFYSLSIQFTNSNRDCIKKNTQMDRIVASFSSSDEVYPCKPNDKTYSLIDTIDSTEDTTYSPEDAAYSPEDATYSPEDETYSQEPITKVTENSVETNQTTIIQGMPVTRSWISKNILWILITSC
ncbi:hypothetical protein RF11_04979 [Thelohanellus kitauei]|uniref:Uncharacterized protein n=1 Tax=Thelohanellus kitauei TaxID=669202 RepID=A0A0C2JYS5_THEKT|nr:hypothetical protein RF11_04979 [Thelohanellus kitauei]